MEAQWELEWGLEWEPEWEVPWVEVWEVWEVWAQWEEEWLDVEWEEGLLQVQCPYPGLVQAWELEGEWAAPLWDSAHLAQWAREACPRAARTAQPDSALEEHTEQARAHTAAQAQEPTATHPEVPCPSPAAAKHNNPDRPSSSKTSVHTADHAHDDTRTRTPTGRDGDDPPALSVHPSGMARVAGTPAWVRVVDMVRARPGWLVGAMEVEEACTAQARERGWEVREWGAQVWEVREWKVQVWAARTGVLQEWEAHTVLRVRMAVRRGTAVCLGVRAGTAECPGRMAAAWLGRPRLAMAERAASLGGHSRVLGKRLRRRNPRKRRWAGAGSAGSRRSSGRAWVWDSTQLG